MSDIDLTAKPGSALDTIARLKQVNAELVEALKPCPQFIILAIIDAKATGKMLPESIARAEHYLEMIDKALASAKEM